MTFGGSFQLKALHASVKICFGRLCGDLFIYFYPVFKKYFSLVLALLSCSISCSISIFICINRINMWSSFHVTTLHFLSGPFGCKIHTNVFYLWFICVFSLCTFAIFIIIFASIMTGLVLWLYSLHYRSYRKWTVFQFVTLSYFPQLPQQAHAQVFPENAPTNK